MGMRLTQDDIARSQVDTQVKCGTDVQFNEKRVGEVGLNLH